MRGVVMSNGPGRVVWGALIVLLGASCLLPSHVQAKAQCFGPYTLNSTNYAPSTEGDDVRDWVGDFTINLSIASGTMALNVEGKLDGGAFASLGTMNATAVAQFHGPLHRLRYNVTSCSSCLATIIACANKGD